MSRRLRILLAVAALAFVAIAIPAAAITKGGREDGSDHPYAGLSVHDVGGSVSHRCSGAFIDAHTFITAGHCTFGTTGGRLVSKSEDSLEIDSGALTLYVNRDEDTQRSFIPSFDVRDGARAALQLQVAGCEVEPSASGGRYFRDPFGLVFDIVERVTQTAEN